MGSLVTFSTADIVLSAYLKTKGCRLIEIVKQGSRGTFVFEKVSEEIIEQYDLGQAMVEPKALNHEIKTLTTAVRR